jgi:hypothetical protein
MRVRVPPTCVGRSLDEYADQAGTVRAGSLLQQQLRVSHQRPHLKRKYTIKQCCGSATFWGGSGSGSVSADPCLYLMDPDPAIFVIDLQDANQKLFSYFIFSAYYFLKAHLHLFSKIKSQKESKNSYYCCMMIEGSRSGSIPLTNVSGSRRPKTYGSGGSGFGSGSATLDKEYIFKI